MSGDPRSQRYRPRDARDPPRKAYAVHPAPVILIAELVREMSHEADRWRFGGLGAAHEPMVDAGVDEGLPEVLHEGPRDRREEATRGLRIVGQRHQLRRDVGANLER